MRRLFRLFRCRAAAGAAGAHGGGTDMAPRVPWKFRQLCRGNPENPGWKSIKLGNIYGLYRFMMFYVFVGLFWNKGGQK